MALSFPPLTGRVVDAAHVLSSTTIQNLEQTLATFESTSTNQLVVATIPSLEGGTIEDYGYQLGRAWGIGQKGKNNGVLLLVAPKEHKVRIEVGYGLEGVLTDAQSSLIIQSVILPDFRRGQMELGIVDGTMAIIKALGGQVDSAQEPLVSTPDNHSTMPMAVIIFFIVFLILRLAILPWWFPTFFPFGGGGSMGGFGGGGFGGGFSGGGGSFGGGGASGGW